MARSRKPDSADPIPGDTASLSDLGLRGHVVSRRTAIKAGLGVAAGAGLAATVGTATAPPAQAGLKKLAKANARKMGGTFDSAQITGYGPTRKYAAPYTDLCIPVERADGSILFIGGDTYGTDGPPGANGNDWRAPVGLISNRKASYGTPIITGAITDRTNHAMGLVIQNHDYVGTSTNPDGTKTDHFRTTLPTDVFRIPETNTIYMNICRGGYGYSVEDSLFFRSTDDGNKWEYLRGWPGNTYAGWFQQKSYAVPYGKDNKDPYVYCVSTVFNREAYSGMYLFRVFKSDLNVNDDFCNASPFKGYYGYEGWGYANGQWRWGNQPTTILDVRQWGEVCFRAMDGGYAMSWFQRNQPHPELEDCRAMAFPLPTSDLINRTEQTMVYQSGAPTNPSATPESVMDHPYGPFILPGSTYQNFNFVVSHWNPQGQYYPQDPYNYGVSAWTTSLNKNI